MQVGACVNMKEEMIRLFVDKIYMEQLEKVPSKILKKQTI
ncbi:hypothetical protein HMPREF3189_00760 [Clostridiales bacterium KA00134]|nr:hypothetical protein HMPREF3189_00760 [Clostridiales bacterium KA00134]